MVKIGLIYKITNDINDKVYIGKTLHNSIQERWKEHCKDYLKNRNEKRPLYNAMNKYGIEHFKIEQVEECSFEQIDDREKYWIEYFGSYKYGYNATLGGDGKCLYDHNKILIKLKTNQCFKQVAQEIGCCVDIVSQVAKNNGIQPSNDIWKSNDFINKEKEIYQLDKNNNIVNEFISVAEAAHWCVDNGYAQTYNSGVRGHISEAARGKRKTAYKFKWQYK